MEVGWWFGGIDSGVEGKVGRVREGGGLIIVGYMCFYLCKSQPPCVFFWGVTVPHTPQPTSTQ